MSIYKPTWLYIKQHNQTGLKYFGKTTKPYEVMVRYLGSGTYWKSHLKIHGKDVSTVWCHLYDTKESLVEEALAFSRAHDIIKAKDKNGKKIWANMILENGLDGAPESKIKTPKVNKLKWAPAKDAITGEKLGKVHPLDARWETGEIIHTSVGSRYSAESLLKRKGWKQTDDACKRISESHKGSGNSQYGTTYVINHSTQQKSRVKKELVPHLVSLGWAPGNKHSYSYVKLS